MMCLPCYIGTMKIRFVSCLSLVYFAIYFIALYSIYTPASAQISLKNESSTELMLQEEARQQTRIASERAQLLRAYEAQRAACYQKLAVNDCLIQARDAHNEQMNDLKRQEVALNDVQRKRKGADRLRAIDERNSPQAQLKQAERRGREIEKTAQREADFAERHKARDEKNTAAPAPSSASDPATSSASEQVLRKPVASRDQPRAQTEPQLPRAQRAGQAEKMAQSRQAADQRERAAAERRAKAEQRLANSSKPAAAGLPVPP
jgi:colicin import membrane protein